MQTPEIPFDDMLELFIRLQAKKSDLEQQLKAVRDDLSRLAPTITNEMTSREFESIRTQGATVYLQRDLVVKAINWPKLKSHCKEIMRDESTGQWEVDTTKLPEALAETLTIFELQNVRCRKT